MDTLTVSNKTPIEIALGIDENHTTTARKLYEFLNLAAGQFSRWAKTNIIDNPFATENVDYWGFDIIVEGNKTIDYRLSATFAKKLTMLSKSERGEIARDYFTKIEDMAKNMVIDRNNLSPTTQALMQTVESIAMLESRQNKLEQRADDQDAKIAYFGQKLEDIKDIFTTRLGDWVNDINKTIKKIAQASGRDYKEVYAELYGQLEIEAHISLTRRCEKKKLRMEKEGNTKTAIAKATTKIAIIADDQKLRIIFEDIVKRWAMKYCA